MRASVHSAAQQHVLHTHHSMCVHACVRACVLAWFGHVQRHMHACLPARVHVAFPPAWRVVCVHVCGCLRPLRAFVFPAFTAGLAWLAVCGCVRGVCLSDWLPFGCGMPPPCVTGSALLGVCPSLPAAAIIGGLFAFIGGRSAEGSLQGFKSILVRCCPHGPFHRWPQCLHLSFAVGPMR
jgi:hypothetical protein